MPTWACSTLLTTSRSMGKPLTTLCVTGIHGQDGPSLQMILYAAWQATMSHDLVGLLDGCQ